ncbi:hypothetical protein [Castellaniella sp.]|uniref:hypothetical protein n=1 Tax=Castellaniella sp. TaxID=1955812 RepID=UPI002AFF66DD|nr:hypothetical protein [Castellaniella sp.]
MTEERHECFDHGHWYQDWDGAIYIVPDDRYGLAETYGPDGEMLDAINKAYRECWPTPSWQVDPEVIAEKLDLETVPEYLRRFDPEIGYYHA